MGNHLVCRYLNAQKIGRTEEVVSPKEHIPISPFSEKLQPEKKLVLSASSHLLDTHLVCAKSYTSSALLAQFLVRSVPNSVSA